MSELVKVSIIIPCRNEELYIAKVLENIIHQDFSLESLEVLVIDGMSEDNTTNILQEYVNQYSFIKYFENKDKTVSEALNLGIQESKGDIIVRMDAHSEYPDNYVSYLSGKLLELEADNVGGAWMIKPSKNTLISKAIAYATSCNFGVGNSMYRLKPKKISKVDTVPFGCFRKEIFSRIGLFDTDLVRNQDDELNARIIQNGGSIFLIPEIKIIYYARATIHKMSKMFYQYGFFKPLVNKKLKKPATLRQFAPLVFILILLCLGIELILTSRVRLFLIPITLYILLSFIYSLLSINSLKSLLAALVLPYIFFVIHTSYGIGYLLGFINFYILERKSKKISISR